MKSSVGTRVTVILDVACVWSYLGFTRLRRAVSRYRDGTGDVEITIRPFQVEPDAPAAGEPMAEHLRQVFGPSAEQRKAHVAALGAREGLRFDFDRAVRTNTFEAHRLIAAAGKQGRAEQMTERLFRAHFTDGLNIADPAVLRRLAEEVGVVPSDTNSAAVHAEIARVRRSGVTGVPVFLFDDRPPLVGDQPEEVFTAALREVSRS
jgi:predicted DsbA family dithiol-disulfide isomerase